MSTEPVDLVLYDQAYPGDRLTVSWRHWDAESIYVEAYVKDAMTGKQVSQDVVLTARQARLAAKALKQAAKRAEALA